MNISKRQIGIFTTFLVAIIGFYWAWGKLSSPYGVQRVSFIPSKTESFSIGKMNFSIYQATAGVNQDVIYHFHGRNLDNSIWNDDTYFTSLIQSHWQRNKLDPPTVVSISYGPEWLLTAKNSNAESGLLDDFIANLPYIESKIGSPRNRILVGESMGGLNVLIAGLTYPELFKKVASLCPGVYLDSPFSDYDTIIEAMKRTGADPKIALGVYLLAKKYASNEKEWREISPIELIKKADPSYPELYLSCGLYDKFGNYEGTEALANLAISKGVKTQWHPLYGGHCAIDIHSLANFLIMD